MIELDIKRLEKQLAVIAEESSGLHAVLKPDGTAFAKRTKPCRPPALWPLQSKSYTCLPVAR